MNKKDVNKEVKHLPIDNISLSDEEMLMVTGGGLKDLLKEIADIEIDGFGCNCGCKK